MSKISTCVRCSQVAYMMASLETDVIASDLLPTTTLICGPCSVVLWDWLQENVTPLYILGAEREVPHDRIRGAHSLHIYSDADRAERKWHKWFISPQDADRVLDFLTRPH